MLRNRLLPLSLSVTVGVVGACVPRALAQCALDKLRYPGGADSGPGFAASVAIWGDVAVAGAPNDAQEGIDSGAAYVYRYDAVAREWGLETMLLADDRQSGDRFGSVAAWTDLIVVGAGGDDDLGDDSGAAYVFRRIDGNWVQEQQLLASDGAPQDRFEHSVIWNDVIAVAAPFDDDNGRQSGSVYVFRHKGSGWVQEQKITPDDGGEDDWFGRALALEGDHLLIGAHRHDQFSGAAYMFRYDAAASRWELVQKFLKPDGQRYDFFGSAVAMDGGRIVIGAMGDDEEDVISGGAAYAYLYDGDAGQWMLDEKLTPSDRFEEDHYGATVALSGEFAIVGKIPHDMESFGPPALFRRGDSGWEEIDRLDDIFFSHDGEFGAPVRTSGDRAIVGSGLDDSFGDPLPGSAVVFNLHACECPADFDGSGSATTRDVIVFLNAWAAGHPGADFSRDSRLDTRDVVAFLNAWAGGC